MSVLDQTLHQVPVLETARLVLRGYRPSDFTQYVAMWADRNFYRYLSPRPMVEEEVWATMLRSIGHWALLGYGFWAVEEKATGNFIGAVGFADPKRDLKPSNHGTPEIGWVLAANVHGQGYATEAVEAAIAWGDTHFGGARTVCIIHPDNRASLRLAEKFGYRKYHRTMYKDEPILMLERIANEQ
ncbi:GNAT family N-acetyltransferase [Hymenobacter sp. HD11105]|jgi:RimJ/RimL family protein N-acetyltransferase